MKGGLYYTYGVMQTSGNVLWDDKFIYHFPRHDKQNPEEYNQ